MQLECELLISPNIGLASSNFKSTWNIRTLSHGTFLKLVAKALNFGYNCVALQYNRLI